MKCPGQDMQYWKDDAIFDVKCPECQATVEFYKDDTTRKCHKCGHRFVNPKMDFGCATYCQFAEQCLGTLPEEFVMQQDSLLKDKVAVEMKRYFKSDFKSIGNATKLARYAEKIGRATEGVNLALTLCSSYLFPVAQSIINKQGTNSDNFNLNSAVSESEEILHNLKANSELIEQVRTIISNILLGNHSEFLEEVIVSDARLLADIEDKSKCDNVTYQDLCIISEKIQSAQGQIEAKILLKATETL